jgi:hypothetical protein
MSDPGKLLDASQSTTLLIPLPGGERKHTGKGNHPCSHSLAKAGPRVERRVMGDELKGTRDLEGLAVSLTCS